jgi:hypothetical protein
MNRRRDLEKLGQVYAKTTSPEKYYLFLTFRHSRDNAGPNEFRLRKESELTSKDKNQFSRMAKYNSSMSERHPDVVSYSLPLGSFPFRICVVGPKDKVIVLLEEFIKNFKGEIYPEKEIMKRKTEDIFGDIIYNESSDESDYILFIRWSSGDRLVGNMKQKSNLSQEEKKLFSMMHPYDVRPKDKKIKSYELKGSPKQHLTFVGPEDSVKSYANAYKGLYGDKFTLEVPMKDKTKKHFKDII